jgi:hypothetical protein
MTWDTRDVQRTNAPPDRPPPPMARAMPRQAQLAQLDEAETPLPREVQRAMADLGLVDAARWAVHRRLMTRGLDGHWVEPSDAGGR